MDAEHRKNLIFKNVFSIFKSNSPPADEKSKVKEAELIFNVVSKNAVVFDTAPWESVVLTNLFSSSKIIF